MSVWGTVSASQSEKKHESSYQPQKESECESSTHEAPGGLGDNVTMMGGNGARGFRAGEEDGWTWRDGRSESAQTTRVESDTIRPNKQRKMHARSTRMRTDGLLCYRDRRSVR